jgi:hypothetical protein
LNTKRCSGRPRLQFPINHFVHQVKKAVDGIFKLAEFANSEAVQLRAWRAILGDQKTFPHGQPGFRGTGPREPGGTESFR